MPSNSSTGVSTPIPDTPNALKFLKSWMRVRASARCLVVVYSSRDLKCPQIPQYWWSTLMEWITLSSAGPSIAAGIQLSIPGVPVLWHHSPRKKISLSADYWEMNSKLKSNLSLEINAGGFSNYLKHRFNEEFANLICLDLNFFVPLSLTFIENLDDLKKHIEEQRKHQRLFSKDLFPFRKCQFQINHEQTLFNDDQSFARRNHRTTGEKKPFWSVAQSNREDDENFCLGQRTISDSTDTTTNDDKQQKAKRRRMSNVDDKIPRRKRQVRSFLFHEWVWSKSANDFRFDWLVTMEIIEVRWYSNQSTTMKDSAIHCRTMVFLIGWICSTNADRTQFSFQLELKSRLPNADDRKNRSFL